MITLSSLVLDVVGYCGRVEVVQDGITWTWPRTIAGGVASLQCPCEARPELTEYVRAVRLCLTTGKWDNANVATCFSEAQRLLCNVRVCSSHMQSSCYCTVTI